MLQAWLSIGYIVILAVLVLAFSLWRRGGPVLAIAALVVGTLSGLDGNTHVQHGQPGSSQERKCAAAIPTLAAIRPTSNTSTCAIGPTGGSSWSTTIPGGG